jgi:hypothetical protein
MGCVEYGFRGVSSFLLALRCLIAMEGVADLAAKAGTFNVLAFSARWKTLGPGIGGTVRGVIGCRVCFLALQAHQADRNRFGRLDVCTSHYTN